MHIRKAAQQDLHSIMKLYENARIFMREHGNPDQWGTAYPPQNMIEADICPEIYTSVPKTMRSRRFSSIKKA